MEINERYRSLRQQYAQLCSDAFSRSHHKESAYARGYGEFELLANEKGVAAIGVNLEKTELYIGTEPIYLFVQEGGYWIDIGEILLTQSSASTVPYHCQNITRNVNGHGHPHLWEDGHFCIDVSFFNVLQNTIRNAYYLASTRMLLRALHTLGPGAPVPNAKPEDWPHIEVHYDQQCLPAP